MREGTIDQAAGLRRLGTQQPVNVIAITGGKGGVGKTVVAVNLGAALAAQGRSTMLLDADLGLANVDVLLNLGRLCFLFLFRLFLLLWDWHGSNERG